MGDKIVGEPSYYELIEDIILFKSQYHPIIPTDCHLLIYKQSDLINPTSLPICKFHYAGILKFIIGDCEYAACDIDIRELDIRSRQLQRDEKILNYDLIQWWIGNQSRPTNNNSKLSRKVRVTTVPIMKMMSKLESGIEEYERVCVYKC